MNKLAKWSIIIGALWIILGCGWAYVFFFHPGLGTVWKKVPSPLEKPFLLRVGSQGEILAETSDGKLFEYSNEATQTWVEVESPSGTPSWYADANCNDENNMYLVVPPPGKIKSTVKLSCGFLETGYYREFALLENGEIWLWEHEVYAYTHLMKAFFLVVFGLLGLLPLGVGVMTELLIFFSRRKNNVRNFRLRYK